MGTRQLDPQEVSNWLGRDKRGMRRRLRWAQLVGCHTLSSPGRAAAWARVTGGNVWGTDYSLNIKWYAWGMPGAKLEKYEKWKARKQTWWGGSKKWYPRK